jgi:hypothetical protein
MAIRSERLRASAAFFKRQITESVTKWILVIAVTRVVDVGAVTLTWNKNPEPDIAGYKLYWGEVRMLRSFP